MVHKQPEDGPKRKEGQSDGKEPPHPGLAQPLSAPKKTRLDYHLPFLFNPLNGRDERLMALSGVVDQALKEGNDERHREVVLRLSEGYRAEKDPEVKAKMFGAAVLMGTEYADIRGDAFAALLSDQTAPDMLAEGFSSLAISVEWGALKSLEPRMVPRLKTLVMESKDMHVVAGALAVLNAAIGDPLKIGGPSGREPLIDADVVKLDEPLKARLDELSSAKADYPLEVAGGAEMLVTLSGVYAERVQKGEHPDPIGTFGRPPNTDKQTMLDEAGIMEVARQIREEGTPLPEYLSDLFRGGKRVVFVGLEADNVPLELIRRTVSALSGEYNLHVALPLSESDREQITKIKGGHMREDSWRQSLIGSRFAIWGAGPNVESVYSALAATQKAEAAETAGLLAEILEQTIFIGNPRNDKTEADLYLDNRVRPIAELLKRDWEAKILAFVRIPSAAKATIAEPEKYTDASLPAWLAKSVDKGRIASAVYVTADKLAFEKSQGTNNLAEAAESAGKSRSGAVAAEVKEPVAGLRFDSLRRGTFGHAWDAVVFQLPGGEADGGGEKADEPEPGFERPHTPEKMVRAREKALV
jgi:hypothetical protein